MQKNKPILSNAIGLLLTSVLLSGCNARTIKTIGTLETADKGAEDARIAAIHRAFEPYHAFRLPQTGEEIHDLYGAMLLKHIESDSEVAKAFQSEDVTLYNSLNQPLRYSPTKVAEFKKDAFPKFLKVYRRSLKQLDGRNFASQEEMYKAFKKAFQTSFNDSQKTSRNLSLDSLNVSTGELGLKISKGADSAKAITLKINAYDLIKAALVAGATSYEVWKLNSPYNQATQGMWKDEPTTQRTKAPKTGNGH